MKFIKKKRYALIICLILIILCIFLISNKNSDNQTMLKDKEEIKVDKKQFGMYIENENGEFVEYTDSELFPDSTIYLFNIDESYCVDNKDNILENVISYADGKVTVTSSKTIYCYLYFDYDPAPESFTFYLGGSDNPEYVTSTTTMAYLSWEDNDITHYCVTNTQGSENCTWNEVSENSIEVSHELTGGDGEKTVYAYIKDKMGNISPEMSDTIYLDTSAPTDNSVSINSGATYATSTSVTLTLSSSGATQMCISNTSSCSSWEDYTTSKSHTLTTGDGTKTVYVWFRDEYGNTSEYVADSITLDTQAPTSNSVSINSGATYTTSTSVTLTLSSTGATQMCISNTTSCSSWVTYATSKSWTLTAGDGTKTVYVWYKDAAGNTTSTYVSDSITLDTAAPTVTASASNTKISITSSEAGTYCVNTTNTPTNFSNCTLTGSISANTAITTSALSSSGTYYVHVKDAAGNVGGSSSVSITISNPFGTYLRNAKTSGFNSNMDAGLYRYQGTSVNNYVCFGTSTKSTCTGNTDAYMYRIIGVNSSGQVKVIKKEALNSTMQWYSTDASNITWPDSTIYKNINGSSFLTNTTYMPSGWKDKIETTTWKYGDNDSVSISSSSLYSSENSWSSTVSAKIGLMYRHDFAYAYQSGGLNCGGSDYSKCKTAWLYLALNDSGAPNASTEWTMSRFGANSNGAYFAYAIDSYGMGYSYILNNYFSVRPVFYLTSSVNYVSGSGTSTDPFIIS